jgi:hypothetical protein
MSIDTIRADAIALLNAGALNTPAFERLAEEYGRHKGDGEGEGATEPQSTNRGRPPMATKKAVKAVKAKAVTVKGVNGKEVRRSGFGRGAASNWDAFGTTVKTKGIKLEDGVYQVKDGELRRMADTNGTGQVCVVYRVAAKAKAEAPVKAKKVTKEATKPAKKTDAKKPVTKKESPAPAKKAVTKKDAPAKKGTAKKGK